jgi:hypothetical protein
MFNCIFENYFKQSLQQFYPVSLPKMFQTLPFGLMLGPYREGVKPSILESMGVLFWISSKKIGHFLGIIGTLVEASHS